MLLRLSAPTTPELNQRMKTKFVVLLLLLAAGAGAVWYLKTPPPAAAASTAPKTAERKILYYQSAMHPWIKSDKPGKCPICGMDLVPVYADDPKATNSPGMVVFTANTISVADVQTEPVARRPIIHTLHVIGRIEKNSTTAAWFVFDVYERDLPWIKPGMTLDVTLPAVPDRIYKAKIKVHGGETFADRDLDDTSDSTKVRAQIENPPVEVPGFEGKAYFNSLHAESSIQGTTPEVLAVPRSAVISRGNGPMVYVENSPGHYSPQPVVLGRTGDEYYEVLSGLTEDEAVVTHGGLLIDAEAQLLSER
jgi:hypothetical protein